MTPTETTSVGPSEGGSPSRVPGFLNRIEIGLIHVYKRTLSPFIGQHCRFHPSCSTYGIHSLERYGFLEANTRILWRILRCNPFSRGGYDPA